MFNEEDFNEWAHRAASQLADEVENTLIRPLNEFLMAPTRDGAANVLRKNPRLTSPAIIKLVDKFIGETAANGDTASNTRLKERRRMLQP